MCAEDGDISFSGLHFTSVSIFYVPVRIVPPVADVLAHGPPIPLIIDRIYLHKITAQDKEDTLLALKHRHRILRIRLQIPVPDLETLIVAMDGEFLKLMLEFLSVTPQWPQTFTLYEVDAPIDLSCATSTPPHAIGCRLSNNIPITTSPASLVSLSLRWVRPSTFLLPDESLQRLSFVPRLEVLQINFGSSVFDDNVEKQMSCAPIMTHVALPNPSSLCLRG